MAKSIPISIELTGGNMTPVEFPEEQVTATLELVPEGPRLYRIASVPVMVEAAHFGDVIEAEPGPDGGLRFVRVADAGGWRTYEFLLPKELVESPCVTAIQDRVLSFGGHWERVFGGIFLICLPPTSDYDPTGDLKRGT